MGGWSRLHLAEDMTSITVALLIIIAAAASVLIGLAALISLASRREDAEWTLGEPSPGLDQAARRVLGFHSGGALASSSGRTARTSAWGGSATSADPDAVDDDRGR